MYDIVVDIDAVPKDPKTDFWSVYVSKDLESAFQSQLEKNPEIGQSIDILKASRAELEKELKETKDEGDKRDIEEKIRNVEKDLLAAEKKLTENMMQYFTLDQRCALVGVFGLFNRGKTHILNKIAKTSLPSGKKVHTRGVSLKKPYGLAVILLDTAGSSSPMNNEWKKRYHNTANAITEKKTLELLIQEITFRLVDQVIVVVGDMTWQDQEYIQILQKQLEESTKNTSLIVIHNFCDVETEEDLFDMWQAVLNSTVGTIMTLQSEFGEIFYYKEDVNLPGVEKAAGTTEHYFLAKDGSPAGEKFNPRTYDVLTKRLTNISFCNKLTIQEQLEASAISSLKLFTVKPESLEWTFNKDFKIPSEENVSKTRIDEGDWKKHPTVTPKSIIGHFFIKVKGDLQLTHVANFTGFQITLVQNYFDYKPPYDVINGPDYFTVAVDLCGISNDQINASVVVPKEQHRIGNTHIKINGKRTLYTLKHKVVNGKTEHEAITYEKEGFQDKKYTLSPLSINSLSKKRTGGEFEIIVDLPDKVSRNDAVVTRSNGVFYYSLPLLKTDKNKPKILNVEF